MKRNWDDVYLLANLEPTLVLDSECMSNAHGRASTNGTCAGMKNVALRRRQMPEFYQSEHPYLGLVKSYLQPSSQRIHDLHLTTCLCEQNVPLQMHELRERCKPDLKYSKFYGFNFEVANEAAYTLQLYLF